MNSTSVHVSVGANKQMVPPMPTKPIRPLLAALFALVLPITALAQPEACLYRQPILTLADRLLADLESPDPSIARFYGRDAAYLKLYYGQMDGTGIDRMLDGLSNAKASGAVQFAYAYYLSRLGYEAATVKMSSRLGTAEARALDLTLMRALARAGRFDLIVAMLKGVREWPDKRYLIPMALPFVDNPPDERKRMADLADSGGALLLAGELYASLPDYEGWKGYLKRHFTTIGYRNLDRKSVV